MKSFKEHNLYSKTVDELPCHEKKSRAKIITMTKNKQPQTDKNNIPNIPHNKETKQQNNKVSPIIPTSTQIQQTPQQLDSKRIMRPSVISFKSRIGIRPTNEDKHTIIQNLGGTDKTKQPIELFGIYDGHGGQFVSNKLSEIIPTIFLDNRMKYPLRKQLVEKICATIQNIFKNNYTAKSIECGSTCLVALRYDVDGNDILNVINVGDSRAIICSGTSGYAITTDHKPLNPNESQRITNQGGQIYCDGIEWRVGALSLSRSFGDIKSVYTQPQPDFYVKRLNKNDKFIVLACDGLWDVMETHEVVDYILHFCYNNKGERINENLDIAGKLTKYAIDQGSGDNVSVMVIFL